MKARTSSRWCKTKITFVEKVKGETPEPFVAHGCGKRIRGPNHENGQHHRDAVAKASA